MYSVIPRTMADIIRKELEDGRIVVVVNGKTLSTNHVGARTIELLSEGLSEEEVKAKLKHEGIEAGLKDISRLSTAIYSSGQVVRSRSGIRLLASCSLPRNSKFIHILSMGFSPVVAIVSLLALSLLVPYSHVLDFGFADYLQLVYNTPVLLLVYVLANVLILAIHELGHIAAAYKCKVTGVKIGIGLYLIYPIFYTDVTQSWLHSRKDRLLIDAGGVYFQVLLSVLLLLGSLGGSIEVTLMFNLLFWENLVVLLFNLNPFGAFDGYWLVSDLIEVRHLRQKSFASIANLLVSRRIDKLQVPFILYFFLSIGFVIGICLLSIYRLVGEGVFLVNVSSIYNVSIIQVLRLGIWIFLFWNTAKTIILYCNDIYRRLQNLRRAC